MASRNWRDCSLQMPWWQACSMNRAANCDCTGRPHMEWPRTRVARSAPLALDDAEFVRTATGSGQPVTTDRASLDAGLPQFYRHLLGGLAVESAMALPLIARGRPLGELILGKRSPDAFSNFDLELLGTAAASIASGDRQVHSCGSDKRGAAATTRPVVRGRPCQPRVGDNSFRGGTAQGHSR